MHAYVYSTELHVLHACSCQVLCLFVRCTPIFDFCIFTGEGAVTCLISRPNIKGFSYLRYCNFSSLPLQFYRSLIYVIFYAFDDPLSGAYAYMDAYLGVKDPPTPLVPTSPFPPA